MAKAQFPNQQSPVPPPDGLKNDPRSEAERFFVPQNQENTTAQPIPLHRLGQAGNKNEDGSVLLVMFSIIFALGVIILILHFYQRIGKIKQ